MGPAVPLPIHRLAGICILAAALAACADATGPTLDDVRGHRVTWSAQHLSDYTYTYEVTRFFIKWEDQQLRIDVRNGAVASAVLAATGESVSDTPSDFPTIDGLFDRAAQAARDHTLRDIVFDPRLGYPVRRDLAGPPDASGSVFAIQLHPVP